MAEERQREEKKFLKGGGGWISGMNSVRSPWLIPENQYPWAVNVQTRGGVPRTRPGYAHRLTLPDGKKLQGMTVFTIRRGTDRPKDMLVVFVDGIVYAVPFPLEQPSNWRDYDTGIRLDPDAEMIYFAKAEKTANLSRSGDVVIIPTTSVLIMQDGKNPAVGWDGTTQPQIAQEKEFGIPTGTWMAWSGQRLWVAVGNVLVASDYADPYAFSERVQGAARGDVVFTRDITGLGVSKFSSRQEALLVFTDNTTEALDVSRQNREEWLTQGFRQTVYANIGCVSGRSITFHAGLTWWRSEEGLVNTDPAQTEYISAQVNIKDVELARSKARWSANLRNCCSASFGGMLLSSVPYQDTYNSHTAILDFAVMDEMSSGEAAPAWASVWTGIRPVEYALRYHNGRKKLFAASVDYDHFDGSRFHVWELFQADRADYYFTRNDSGQKEHHWKPIYCEFETSLYGDGMNPKRLHYIDADLVALENDAAVEVEVRSSNGPFITASRYYLNAAMSSNIPMDAKINEELRKLIEEKWTKGGGFVPQNRRLRTNTLELIAPSDGLCLAETPYLPSIGKAFSVKISWRGSLGIEALVLLLERWPEHDMGQSCAADERNQINARTASGESFSIGSRSPVNLPFTPSENPFAWIGSVGTQFISGFYSSGPEVTVPWGKKRLTLEI